MINISIPKDIREYQPKFIGPFTVRETASIAIAGGFAFIGAWFEKSVLKMPAVTYIPFLVIILPILFFGFGEKFLKIPPEKYLQTVFFSRYVAKRHRVFETKNLYDTIWDPIEEEEEEDPKEKKKQMKKERALPKEYRAFQ